MPSHRSPEAERFEEYLEKLGVAVGHADRREPLRAYLTGLLLPGERKSVEPMAAKLDPGHVRARHQSMHHFVAQAPWSEQDLLRVSRDHTLAQLERHGPVSAWVVDDTGIPKKGSHSVGVAHQYCGVLGKTANCQVAVTVSLVNPVLSVPSGFRLYLPESWVQDSQRCRATGVPEEVKFQTKWEIALDQVAERGVADRPRGSGCGIWCDHRVPGGTYATGSFLCRGDLGRDEPLAPGPGTPAAQALVRPGAAASAVAQDCRAPARVGGDSRPPASASSMEDGALA